MKLAIYDFDGTYSVIHTIPFLLKTWKNQYKNKTFKREYRKIILRYLMHKVGLFGWGKQRFREYAMKKTLRIFSSVSKEMLDDIVQKNYVLLQPYISNTMKQYVKRDKKNGYTCVLLSGNFLKILQPFLKDGFDNVIGTTLYKENRLKTEEELDIIMNQKKVEALESYYTDINWNDSIAYADSYYDAFLLKRVNKAYAVQPDKQLRQLAKQYDWPIIEKK